jgi:hypothetical protein
MKTWKDYMGTGFAAGILVPVIAFYIFVLYYHQGESFMDVARFYYKRKVITHIISLTNIANLGMFFLFLRFQYERSARGVLGATLLWAMIVVAIKFL